MIVMKFGGTSVGSAERIRVLTERVRERHGRGPVVVVSAFSGVTDELIRGAERSLESDADVRSLVAPILKRHEEAIEDLIPAGELRARLLQHVRGVVAEVEARYSGIQALRELTRRTLDAVAGAGEKMCFMIVSSALAVSGLPAQAIGGFLVTDDTFGEALPEVEGTRARIQEHVVPIVKGGGIPVVPGFVGSTEEGVATTLGRGGSDFSAAIIGALLPAEEIQIWTDVDGMMTVDPRVVTGARSIPEVSFDEAAELAYFGAKVLHPATIKPAVEKGIPVIVRNSLNPAFPGTRISGRAKQGGDGPRAIAFKKGITVLLISQPRMLMAFGFVARVFEVFNRYRTSVDLIATSEVSISLTVDDTERLSGIRKELEALGEVSVFPGMAIVSLVGSGFMRTAGLAARIFKALQTINVGMISFGASDVNIALVVAGTEVEPAVKLLHAEFFES